MPPSAQDVREHEQNQRLAEFQRISTELATNFNTPAQRIINAGFARLGIDRFDREGNDLWEMYTCEKNGWEYEKPPAHLVSRWAGY
jgi:hypothetical protein